MTHQIPLNNAKQAKPQLTGFSRKIEQAQDRAYIESGPYFPPLMTMMLS